jgi:WD40 repeat protein/uncharacterized protein YwqG
MNRILWLICVGLVAASPLSAEEPGLRKTFKGHIYQVTAVAFSPDGKTLASGSCDRTIKLWDVATGKNTATLTGHTNAILCVTFSWDGRKLASGDWDGTIRLWDVGTGKNRATINGHSERIPALAFHPDGTTLASGGWDNAIKLWSVDSFKNVATLDGHNTVVNSVAFSPDGKTLASGSHDNTVKLWDVATGKSTATLKNHTDVVFSVAFSPDGKTVASASGDKTIKLWTVATAKETATLKDTHCVLSVAFSPDGKTLASGSQGETIKLWDVATGRNVGTLGRHVSWVESLAFNLDGKTLASTGNTNNTIMLWDIPATKKHSGNEEGWQISTESYHNDNISTPQRVADAKKKLRKELEKSGLGRVAGDLEKMMAVSIRLTAKKVAEGELKPGGSKLGGTPDLPEGTAWPQCNGMPMALLAQLRLQDVAPYDLNGQLPRSGILYFFYEAEAQRPGNPEDRPYWQVIYYDGGLAGLRPARTPADLPDSSRFQTCKVTFSDEITLPPWGSEGIERLKLSSKEDDSYIRRPQAGENGEPIHRLLGYPEQVQVHDMPLECQCASHGLRIGDLSGKSDPQRLALEKGASDWRLLFQIDSDKGNLGSSWGDAGRVYFWIREQDLKKRDFSKVWLIMQCL